MTQLESSINLSDHQEVRILAIKIKDVSDITWYQFYILEARVFTLKKKNCFPFLKVFDKHISFIILLTNISCTL